MSDAVQELQPRVAQTKPCYRELKKGDVVMWCACGRSASQPFCDGSHRGTPFKPVRYEAMADEEVLFCGCKRSADAPRCDGSHNALIGAYGTDDPDSVANRRIIQIEARGDGKAMLDGGCYVCSVEARPSRSQGNLSWRSIIDASDGAQYQAMFMIEVGPGLSPWIAFGDRHVALLLSDGEGELEIAGEQFDMKAVMGAYAKPGEAIRLQNRHGRSMKVFASVGPTVDAPTWPEQPPSVFGTAYPQRTIALDATQRQAMGERYFQMLVDRRHGSTLLTQFIGEIPRGKALPHRHLYEESLIVVAGEGMMWTEGRKAPVNTGDVIFLPRKQLHSLECTSDTPMLVVGVIYPGDNPAINYYD